MHGSSSSQVIDVPLELEQHREKPVWRPGVRSLIPCVDPEAIVYFDTRDAAKAWRADGLLRGDVEVLPDVAEISVNEASDYARSLGVPRVRVLDSELDVVEWWWV